MSSLSVKNAFGANTLSEVFVGYAQMELDRALVGKGIAKVDSRNQNLFHNPYRTNPVGFDGSAVNTYSTETFTATDDTLQPNRRAGAAEHVDNLEQALSGDDLMAQRARRMGVSMAEKIDRYVLALPTSFSGVTDIDSGYMSSGVSDGTPYAASNSNVDDLSNAIYESLALGNAMEKAFWVVSPYEASKITSYRQNQGFDTSDKAITAGMNGFQGYDFGGLDLFVSNQLKHTVTLTVDTNPTANDTFTLIVSGRPIVFTFVASPAAAGDIDIAGTAAGTQANIVLAINGTGTPGASTYTDLSASDRYWLKSHSPLSAGVSTACGAFSSDIATITMHGSLKVAETFTAGTNVFGTVARHTIAGVRGSIFLAMPSGAMEFDRKAVGGQHGRELVLSQAYNATIWNNDTAKVKDVIVAG